MDRYHQIFSTDFYVRVSPLYNIITVFDDVQYNSNDYEMLSPPQRKQVIEALEKNDHVQDTGKTLKDNSTGRIVRLVQTASQGVSPLHEFEKHYNQTDVFVTTPGSYFLFLMKELFKNQKDQNLLKEIENLITTHPVNLIQLLYHSKKDDFHLLFHDKIDHFKSLQHQAVIGPLSNKKALGKLL
jgi:hypothetical protein